MRKLLTLTAVLALIGCSGDDISYLSIRNDVPVPIYAVPYSSELSDGEWIQPGVTDEFYSLNCDCLDGYAYFTTYYDSLIVYISDHEEDPIRFHRDGTTKNYDPALNPFINREIWQSHSFEKRIPGSSFETMEEKKILEHFFSIKEEFVPFLADSLSTGSDPAL